MNVLRKETNMPSSSPKSTSTNSLLLAAPGILPGVLGRAAGSRVVVSVPDMETLRRFWTASDEPPDGSRLNVLRICSMLPAMDVMHKGHFAGGFRMLSKNSLRTVCWWRHELQIKCRRSHTK